MKKILIFLFITGFASLAMAQEGELPDEQIIIQKDKKIVLPEITKPDEKVSLTLKPLPKVKQKYGYKDFLLQLPPLDPKLKAPVFRNEPEPTVKQGFVKLGVGNYGSTLLDAYYNSGREKDYAWGAYIKHNASASGPVKNSGFSTNDLGASGKYFMPSFTLSGGLNYNRSRYNFYGYDHSLPQEPTKDSIRQIFQTIAFNLQLENNQKKKPLNYRLGMGIHRIADALKASESEISFVFDSRYKIKDSSAISLFSDISLAKRADSASQNRSLWRLKPLYSFSWKGFAIQAGFQLAIDNEPELKKGSATEYTSKTRTHLYPHLALQQQLMGQKIVAFAGLEGGMIKRTLRSHLEINPFLAPNVYLRHENQLLNFYLGLKGNIKDQFQYHSSISFETLDNQSFYLNDPLERREKFVLVYDSSNTKRFTWENQTIYDVGKNTRAGLKFSLLSYGVTTLKEPWHAPHSLASVFIRQMLSEKIALSGEFYYMGGLKARNPETDETERLKGLADLNLKGEYFFKNRFSAYLSVHNLLNNKNQRFYLYPTQGIRLMVGATAVF